MTRDTLKKALFRLGLNTYVKWLNENLKMDGMDTRYSPDDFLKNDGNNHFGYHKILSFTRDSGNSDAVMHVILDDGDEGGAHDLIIGFEGIDESKILDVQFIMQGFDGTWQTIYNDGKLIHS